MTRVDALDPVDASTAVEMEMDADSTITSDLVATENDGGSELPARGAGLKQLALRGAAWTIAGYGASQVLRLGSNLVLTRLLFPEVFGLMALVNVVIQGLHMFSDVGIGPSIIQNKRGEDPAFLNTAWSIQVFRGFAMAAVCAAIAYPVSLFYEEPLLVQLLPVAGLTALIEGFNNPSWFVANRKLALGRLTVLELATQTITIAVMIVWALQWPSVWALLAGSIVGSLLRLVGTHFWLSGERCHFAWDRESAHALMRFGRWIFVSTVLSFLVGQGDRLLFGKLLGVEVLGVYSIAVMLAMLPRQILGRMEGTIVFPSLSRVQGDRERFARVFSNIRSALGGTAGCLATLLMACGPYLIEVMYDKRYHDAGWMLQIVAVSVLLQSLESLNGSALLACGKSASVAAGGGAKLVGIALFTTAGWWFFGLRGAISGFVLSELCRYCVSALLVSRLGYPTVRQDLHAWVRTSAGVALGGFFGLWLQGRGVASAWLLCFAAAVPGVLLWYPVIRRSAEALRMRSGGEEAVYSPESA